MQPTLRNPSPSNTAAHDEPAQHDSISWAELGDHFTERVEAFGGALKALWLVHKDKAQLAVRRRLQSAIWLGALAFAGGTATIYAVCLLVGGMAKGFGQLFQGRQWMGDLLTGVLLLGLLGGGLAFGIKRTDRRELAKQQEKYDKLRNRQRQASQPAGTPAN